DAGGGGFRVKPHGAAVEPVGRDIAEHDVGIGYGGLLAAAAVADRAWLGAGAVRPDNDHTAIGAGDAAAPGADLDHLHGGHVDGQAAAFLVAHHVDLEGRHDGGLAVVYGAELGGGT